jgi:uncharacterized protein YbjT (DUF2867 family)
MKIFLNLVVLLVISGQVPAADVMNEQVVSDKLILVIGATGQQGGATARELLVRGYRVRGLTRNPEKPRARALSELGVEMVRGDLDDKASLAAAVEGADGVFAITDYWEHGYQGEMRHGRNIVDAVKTAGTGHLVYSSVASANRDTGIPHFDSKQEIEIYIRDSGVDYTIIRPVSFMQNWSGARSMVEAEGLRTPQRPESLTYLVSTRDSGRFAAQAFDNPGKWLGVELDIAGDKYTMAELAVVFSDVLRQPVGYTRMTWDDYEKANGEEMTVMVRWFDEVGYDVDIDKLRRENPWMVRFEDYLGESW